jgi:predicted transposase YbfD/YdcC
VRKIGINRTDAEYVREQLNVPDCNVLIRVDREVRQLDGKTTVEPRYFISSLRLSAGCLLRLIRRHWEVENGLHWMKDRYWDEDKHYLKRGQDVFVAMTDEVLTLLRLMQESDETVREVAEEVHFCPKKVLQIIGIT